MKDLLVVISPIGPCKLDRKMSNFTAIKIEKITITFNRRANEMDEKLRRSDYANVHTDRLLPLYKALSMLRYLFQWLTIPSDMQRRVIEMRVLGHSNNSFEKNSRAFRFKMFCFGFRYVVHSMQCEFFEI